jgi:hypothetical protein
LSTVAVRQFVEHVETYVQDGDERGGQLGPRILRKGQHQRPSRRPRNCHCLVGNSLRKG